MKYIGLTFDDFFDLYKGILNKSKVEDVSKQHRTQVVKAQKLFVKKLSRRYKEDEDFDIGYDVSTARHIYGTICTKSILNEKFFNLIKTLMDTLNQHEKWLIHFASDISDNTCFDQFFYNNDVVYFYLKDETTLEDILKDIQLNI